MYFNHGIIKKMRRDLNLTQAELGTLLNCRQNTISQWENGERTPDIDSIVILANLFHLSFESFFLAGDPFQPVGELNLEANSERDLQPILAQQAWIKYAKEAERYFYDDVPLSDAVVDTQKFIEFLSDLKEDCRMLNGMVLPITFFDEVRLGIHRFALRCTTMSDRLIKISKLPEEDKQKQHRLINETMENLKKQIEFEKAALKKHRAEEANKAKKNKADKLKN